MGLRHGYIYKLKDGDYHEDEKGFDHVLVAVESSENYWIVDCWIVDQRGNQSLVVDSCPVPIRVDDVIIDSGRYIGNINGEGINPITMMMEGK